MTNTEKQGYTRDYSHEHKIRSLKKKRLICDMNKEKVEQFNAILKQNDITFSKWLHEKIDEYIEKEI
jgi:hypothetical protein